MQEPEVSTLKSSVPCILSIQHVEEPVNAKLKQEREIMKEHS